MQRASPSSSPSSAANTPVKSSQPASPASPLSTPGPSSSTLIPGSPSFGAEEEQWSLSPAAIAKLRAKARGQSQKAEAKGVSISQEAGFDAWLIEREKQPTSGEGKNQSARQTFGKLGKQKDEDEEREGKQDSKKRARGTKEEHGQEPDFEESEDSDEELENPKGFVKPGSIKGKKDEKKREGDSSSPNKKAKKNAKAGKDQDKVVFARKRGGKLGISGGGR
ncbi:hypothetical protein PHSY_002450 [Pseudozyma hubeiensis SY62]|uniref:Uncharacterized protein n=1 Tax=Pseudozyma hubeiensis (strain SY62) TaxID=1305764 RepID=R9P1A6_PSEHS|nr:hypothetical protein PHSY_002450 [Pseudozyma hubeiensis SY62]GAC94877.1 hypothetical protein PHSY_002450 [Pseudozyma hubeiensis SY62]